MKSVERCETWRSIRLCPSTWNSFWRTCKNHAVLLWAIPLKQKPAEATSTLSYGCRRSGRNPLHLWREGSQLGESEKLPVLPNRTNWNARRQKCSFDHSFCELPFCCLALWSFPLIYSPFFFFYVKKTTFFSRFFHLWGLSRLNNDSDFILLPISPFQRSNN